MPENRGGVAGGGGGEGVWDAGIQRATGRFWRCYATAFEVPIGRNVTGLTECLASVMNSKSTRASSQSAQ